MQQAARKLLTLLAFIVAVVQIRPCSPLRAQEAKILVSVETTYITEPLATDGLPNYSFASLENQRTEIALQENGAIQLWQALGPCDLSDQDFKAICQEIGLEYDVSVPTLITTENNKDTLALAQQLLLFHQGILEHANIQDLDKSLLLENSPLREDLIKQAQRCLGMAQCQLWTEGQMPLAAACVRANQRQLDLLVEAAAKPHFYSPPPTLLTNPEAELARVHLAAAQYARNAIRALRARAMLNAGRGDLQLAWEDCVACYQLANHFANSKWLADKRVAEAMHRVNFRSIVILLSHEKMTESLAKTILQELEESKLKLCVFDALNSSERLMALDTTLRALTKRLGGTAALGNKGIGCDVDSQDINNSLRYLNSWFDRCGKAAQKVGRVNRNKKLEQIDRELVAEIKEFETNGTLEEVIALLRIATNKEVRRRFVAKFPTYILMPNFLSYLEVEDRYDALYDMTVTAAAISIYRIQHSQYPAELDMLVPEFLPSVPIDIFSEKPLIYERRGDGYLLYSVYKNGVDDYGTDESGEIIAGEWAKTEAEAYDSDDVDLVFRVPAPRFELPQAPQ